MFKTSNFLAPYKNTDTALVFVDSTGIRVRGINVCKYLDSGVKENILWVLLEGGTKLEFGFENNVEAANAALMLVNVLNLLQANCEIGGNNPSPDPIPEPITITYNSYKTLISENNTIPLQYYDIVDSNNVLGKGFGQVYRCIALNTSDSYPQGIVLATNDKIILNCINNKIVYQIIPAQNIIEINKSIVVADEDSSYICAINNSSVTTTASDYITSLNNSILTVIDCQNISCDNSNVTLQLSSNCSFKDVSVNLLTLGNFENIEVSRNTTGKEGNENLDVSLLDNTVLLAYKNYKIQNLLGELNGSNQTIVLRNLPTSDPINAEFTLVIDQNLSFSNKTIIVKDYNTNTTILSIDNSYFGRKVKFKYDIELEKFIVYNDIDINNETKTKVLVLANNQNVFSNVLSFVPQYPNLSFLSVNGQEQEYEVDYNIVGKSINWISPNFNLVTTDVVYVRYK